MRFCFIKSLFLKKHLKSDYVRAFLFLSLIVLESTMHNAGSKVKSQIKANAIMSAESSPNWKVGRKADKVNTKKPETNTVVVIISADPVFMIVLRKASMVGNPLDNSFLYRSKK